MGVAERYCSVVRFPLAWVFLATAGSALADPLIDIPTARKLTYDTFKFEFASPFYGGGTQLAWLDAGIGKSFEATLREQEIDGTRIRPTADLMYSFISALPGTSPGIAFGVQDMANTTPDGRRAYGVVTFREPTQTFDYQVPLDLSIGVYVGRSVLPFAGLALPMSSHVKLLIEDNGYRGAGGIQVDVSKNLSLRLLVRGGNTLGDLVYTSRF